MTARPPSDVGSAQRPTLPNEPPFAWVDAILSASASIRPGTGIQDAAVTIVGAAADQLDDMAVGVCVPGGSTGQLVVARSARESRPALPDPARLFGEYAYERVIPLPYDDGSTLHLAADDEERLAPNGAAVLFGDRLAQVLGAAIRNARAHDRGQSHSAEVQGLKDQVIQSEKLASLGQLAAGIVHELNNPLTSIIAYADYLRKKGERNHADPEDMKRLSRISEAADRILRFSRDLITYSRPATEIPAPIAIHDIIDRALVFCEHVLDQTGVAVERNFGEVGPVRGVAGQLTQVFVNLFTNAAHAMQEGGGLLSITTAMTNREVTITICDDGRGIDADHLPRIFDPFFTTKSDGTGLGLSIVRNIVVNHGGRISANGHQPRGTVFLVQLPLDDG